jgi:hypothetical protein
MKRLAFSDAMARAIAAGVKTETRRLFRPTNPDDWNLRREYGSVSMTDGEFVRLPRFVRGDLAAATCAYWINDSGESFTGADYRFEHPDWEGEFGKARTARVMPAALAPFVVQIRAVEVERLDDITDVAACAEGAVHWCQHTSLWPLSPREAFVALWEHVNGNGSWARDEHAWTWIYRFAVVEDRRRRAGEQLVVSCLITR